MMERGSSFWWFVMLLLASVSVRWERAMTFHLQLNQSNMEHATRLELEAQHLNHSAITHKLQAVLNKHQGEALHQEAAKLFHQSQQKEESYEQEEKLAQEYEELFERATEASQECRMRIDQDEKVSLEAHEKLQGYLDDLDRLKQQHEQFCLHWWMPMWYCDLVAEWTGLDEEEKNVAIAAQDKNDTLLEADREEKLDEALEVQLEKNVTRLNNLKDEAEQEADQLKDAYIQDEQRAEKLEANATELLNSSQAENEAAASDDEKAEDASIEAEGFLKLAQFHGKKARVFAVLSTVSAILVLFSMMTYLVQLCLSMMPPSHSVREDEELKPPRDDELTVASSIMSEHSPLVDHASVDGSTSDISYLTIDLESRSTTTSSVSFLSSAAISLIIQETMGLIHHHAQKIELVGATLLVICLGHMLWSDTLPGLCALI